MTLEELTQKAELALQEQVVVISSQEDVYYEKHGEYFGFNWTPALEVKNGVDTDLGQIQKPSRNFVEADVSLSPATKLPFQMRVIRHHGEEGQGYTIWARAVLDTGEVYLRAQGFGKHFDDLPWFQEETRDERLGVVKDVTPV